MKNHRLVQLVTLLGLSSLASAPALAQYGGGMAPGGGMPGMAPPQGGGADPGTDGPAEKAPDEDEEDDDADPIGPYEGYRRRSQIIELNGLFRFRSQFYRQLDMGQGYVNDQDATDGTPPFPTALDCGIHLGPCKENYLADANLRLRLEPTINITEQVRVRSQIDVLDNLVLGSTPDTLVRIDRLDGSNNLSVHDSLSNTQNPPEVGANGYVSSVRAKRAWGEVDTEFGTLMFGRMPWHWGRGMFFNAGQCLDCDGGTTVDRLMVMTQIYGHRLNLGWDFGAGGRNWNQTDIGLRDLNGPPLDLSQNDDTMQWVGSIAKTDDPEHFRTQAAMGELAVNYGFQLVYRKLGAALYPMDDAQPMGEGSALSRDDLAGNPTYFTNVNAKVFIPDVWFKLGWRALTVEFEAAAVLGEIGNGRTLTEDNANRALSLRQAGWVLASDLALFKDTFFVGFETGGATGDQAENNTTYLNHRWKTVKQPAGDSTIADFKFSPEYHVDQILFRRLYGTVSNAIYMKPQLAYWLSLAETRQVGFVASAIYSMAMESVSTPGNATSYGVEMNLGVTYRNPADGFYAGVTWAVLWPFDALDRPGNAAGDGLWDRNENALNAQTLRLFLGIQF
ncbi:MAG: TIGR04551 family protein [Deltaproteobacteria bacterium]|nr:TIGR04551 family protein [Deltaproteobacteria bacterium]